MWVGIAHAGTVARRDNRQALPGERGMSVPPVLVILAVSMMTPPVWPPERPFKLGPSLPGTPPCDMLLRRLLCRTSSPASAAPTRQGCYRQQNRPPVLIGRIPATWHCQQQFATYYDQRGWTACLQLRAAVQTELQHCEAKHGMNVKVQACSRTLKAAIPMHESICICMRAGKQTLQAQHRAQQHSCRA